MQRFKNILAVVDVEATEHHALQKAADLATRNNGFRSPVELNSCATNTGNTRSATECWKLVLLRLHRGTRT